MIAFDAARGARVEDGALAAALRDAGLTPRQAEATALVARGRSSLDVAAALGISPRTVEKHLQGAFAALGVRTRSQAAERAWSLLGSWGTVAAEPGG